MSTSVMTSTNSGATQYANQRRLVVFPNGGRLAMVYDGTSLQLRYFKPNDTTPQTPAGSTITAINGSMFLDDDGYLHVAYKVSGSTCRHQRGTLTFNGSGDLTNIAFGTTTALDASTSADMPALVVQRSGTGWRLHAVWSQSTTAAMYRGALIDASGIVTLDAASKTVASGLSAAAQTCIANMGSGKVGIVWTGGGIKFMLGTWDGSVMTWGSTETIHATIAYTNSLTCAGSRKGRVGVACALNGLSNNALFERDLDNTWKTLYQIGTWGAQNHQKSVVATPNDDWLFYYANGAGSWGYRRYYRKTNTTTFADMPTDTTNANYPSAAVNTGSRQAHVLFTTGSASPYTVRMDSVAVPEMTGYHMII